MAHPTWVQASAGDVITAATNLANSGTATSSTQDYTADFAVALQISAQGVTAMAATNGIQIDIFLVVAGGSTVDTIAWYTIVIPVTSTSVATVETIGPFPGLKMQVKCSNLDATNHALVGVTSTTLTGVA